ncbi:type I methionyl aminopeptidase [Clostridium sp. MD294]|uniref:type I methionyl aminopeptidase n=1 Tax=Clostridium sp. MD294 TaxID=97138 RepID=UPI0002CB6E0E|nr:type I methionyl aminopeptidase [Clostridium sp. MD294]NDO46061.1 type I methionyl aminopeptidase [Clostridium sp. MD294]USF30275.1 Methionine aminopeptidase 1 [Clostridium sp. MD294]
MAVHIKTREQIEKMKIAGEILAKLDEVLKKEIKPGVTTKQLDSIAEEYIRSQGAVPSFKGYGGFPGSICASVNDEIVHGIPSERKLKQGDIISIDMGSYIGGYHADAARTYAVGEITPELQKLIDVTKQSFFEGIQYAKQGCHLNQIGIAIQKYVEQNGFSVVREYVGHGIGRKLHEDPSVANYRQQRKGILLKRGMTLAIEPMVNMGSYQLKVLKDGWTAVTRDGLCAAHYENTVVITNGEPEILTLLP